MAKIGPQDVRITARMAHLALTDGEVADISQELEGILGYIDKLKELDTEGVEPLTHAVGFDGPLRADEAQPSLDIEDVLKNAPKRDGRFFQVPRIVAKAGSDKGGK